MMSAWEFEFGEVFLVFKANYSSERTVNYSPMTTESGFSLAGRKPWINEGKFT